MTAVGAQRGGRPRGERVRSRLRLGERVGANQLAARQPRQVALLLLLGPEIHERQRPYRRMRAERSAERRIDGDLLADVRRADQIKAEAAVRGRNLEPQQIQLARLLHQPARELPIVLVQLIDDRKHLSLHELRGGPAEQPLFFGELFADEHVVCFKRRREEPAAGDRCLCLRHRFPRSPESLALHIALHICVVRSASLSAGASSS